VPCRERFHGHTGQTQLDQPRIALTRDGQLLLREEPVEAPEPGAGAVLVEGLHVGVPHPGEGRGSDNLREQVLRVTGVGLDYVGI